MVFLCCLVNCLLLISSPQISCSYCHRNFVRFWNVHLKTEVFIAQMQLCIILCPQGPSAFSAFFFSCLLCLPLLRNCVSSKEPACVCVFSHACGRPMGRSVPSHFCSPLGVIISDQSTSPHISVHFCPHLYRRSRGSTGNCLHLEQNIQ